MKKPWSSPAFQAVLVLSVLASWSPSPLPAQEPTAGQARQRVGLQTSEEEILRRLRESGMSREEMRRQLRLRGMNPALADPYYDRLEGGDPAIPTPSDAFLDALVEMGLAGDTLAAGLPGDSLLGRPDSLLADSLSAAGTPIFGKAVFARRTDQFVPLATGPVPPDYRLGPGDEVVLILTGDVERAYSLQVSREGSLVIPDVGRVIVNGLTLADLEDRLYDRLGRVYSGVRRGADATTQFQVSMGRLRVNRVFVIGEVEFPGSYEVPAVADVLAALYQAGGPGEEGSFREIVVRRGSEVAARVDLYDYLLRGFTEDQIRMEQGDVVFVPLAGKRVQVTGAVPREAIFEVLEGEGIVDVLGFAGGPRPDADVERIRVSRTLPPGLRTPERTRVLVDADVPELMATGSDFPLSDGDSIWVPLLEAEQRDMITLEGPVFRPGDFELEPGMTLRQAIRRAGGLRPEAFQPVAHVRRLNPSDSTRSLIRVSLAPGGGGGAAEDVALRDQDEIRIFATPRLRTPQTVRIQGEVKEPGVYDLMEGMTVEDLVLQAGGYTERAQPVEVEVSRMRPGVQRDSVLSTRHIVTMEGRVPWDPRGAFSNPLPRNVDSGATLASEFRLVEGDQVFVRPLPGYVEPGAVEIEGEVETPGYYAFNRREERLSSFVERAGGLTTDAYPRGARLVRDSALVTVNLLEALEEPGSDADPILRPGDVLEVPLYESTVLVTGAVAFESRVTYRAGMDLGDFLEQAGGTLENADESRISVEYPNGERATKRRKLLFFSSDPDVEPGSTVSVPFELPGAGTDWTAIITTALSIASSTATLLLAINRL